VIRILVTGAGGVGGVNFVRSLRAAPQTFYIVGTDFFKYHLEFPLVDARYESPPHDSADYMNFLTELVEREKIDFLHPQPEVEVEVIANNLDRIGCKTLLPDKESIRNARDKYLTYLRLKDEDLVPKTVLYSTENLERTVKELGFPVWVRLRKGAGGRLSLPCNTIEEVKHWVNLWIKKNRASEEDFIIQEYLPGRDIAWDSLWYKGELVTSFARERREYIFPHVSPSRVTGTPLVSRIIRDSTVNDVAVRAVRALDDKPHGFFCLDMKEGKDQKPYVTEINVKVHTTLPLWSYIAVRHFKMSPWANIPYLYVKLGMNHEAGLDEIPKFDLLPECTLLRHIDCGVVLLEEDGCKTRIL
jgi:carbamoyl-phosphate synthase large subunit